ncbi:MAG: type VI secretion system tip protein VgrG [Bacteroidota bacterium]
MPSSPVIPDSDLVTIGVKSNGSPIDGTIEIISIHIDNQVNKVPYCLIEVMDGNPETEDFPVSDGETFVPGAEIEVLAGYENDNSSIFKGVVIEHSIRIKRTRGPVLLVVCKDKSVKMTVGRNNAYFTETTDSEIISKLIGDHDLDADVTSTSNQLKEVVQYYATDWDFIIARAEVNGLIVTASDGTVSVKDPDDETDAVLTLTYGNDIFEFDAVIDAQSQLSSVQSSAWDVESQEVVSGESSVSNFDIGNLSSSTLAEVIGLDTFKQQTYGTLENDMLTSWSKAKATKSKYAKVLGNIKFQGSQLAVPGKLLELKGVGKRFSGSAFVSGVVHEIGDGNWVTTAKIGLSSNWFTETVRTEAAVASGLLPGMQGLQIGKVKQINEDPDSEFRVLVNLPLIQSSDDGVWARLSTFYATNNAGAFFYPEVDDEVVVGFFNDDPRYPVILGSMYSSGRPAPSTPEEENNTKEFVSREQLKVIFDEEQKAITIITPNENQMVFNDEEESITIKDQNGNSIEMSPEGIKINSPASIQITADESITMSGTAEVSISSEGELSMSGLSISASADTELSASADASLSLSSAGELSITGTLVTIN